MNKEEFLKKRDDLNERFQKNRNELQDLHKERELLYAQYAKSIEESIQAKVGQRIKVYYQYKWGTRSEEKVLEGYYDGIGVDKNGNWKYVPKMYKLKKDGSASKVQYCLYCLPDIEEITKIEIVK